MTIESDLNRIAIALEAIAASMSAPKVAHVTPVAAPIPVVQVAPVAVEVPVMAPPAPAMPAAPFPTIAAPVAAPAPVVAPVAVAPVVVSAPAPAPVAAPTVFASKQEMTDFVVSSYRALGAEKGAQIQGVLTAMGFANINDVPPEQWGALKAGIDALKG